MKAPHFFSGAVLIFWGWQVELLPVGIILALILESAGFSHIRFEFKPADFNKFVDISIILTAGTIVAGLTTDTHNALPVLFKWLPLILFPITAAQQFSSTGAVHVTAFFFISRRTRALSLSANDHRTINISYFYALLCLISAGTAQTGGPVFFPAAVLFFAWALWQNRPVRYGPFLWLICILITTGSGFILDQGFIHTRKKLGRWAMQYYYQRYLANPFKASTAIGDIGTLKLSDTIILRVQPDHYLPGAVYLLQQATFHKFAVNTWFANARFSPVPKLALPGQAGSDPAGVWQVNSKRDEHTPASDPGQMVVYHRPVRKRILLALPAGTLQIHGLYADRVEKNLLQTVRATNVRGLVKTRAVYSGNYQFDAPPQQTDLFIARNQKAWLTEVVEQLGLDRTRGPQTVAALNNFFSKNFTYSLKLPGKGEYRSSLENFIRHSRAGHCELFATTTVLLLRQAGIPARYTTGFVAHEKDKLSNTLLVRQRDAHAWAKAWINGEWNHLDTTPPDFMAVDSSHVSVSPIKDILSLISFRLSQLRHETGRSLMEQYGLWLILPLGLILFLRLKQKSGIKRMAEKKRPARKTLCPQKSDAFETLEAHMKGMGLGRHPWETVAAWQARVHHRFNSAAVSGQFEEILQAHTQFCYGPVRPAEGHESKQAKAVRTLIKDNGRAAM